MKNSERIYGLDLLKILLVFGVIFLHLIGKGGVIANSRYHSFTYWNIYLLQIILFCCVNCFAIITGFVSYGKNIKIERLLIYWCQIVFYSLFCTMVIFIIFPDSRKIVNIIRCFLPIIFNNNWYFSAYVCVFLFIPLINKLLDNINDEQLSTYLSIIFVLFSVIGFISRKDPFVISNGYSPIWLIYMYIIGASIKKKNKLLQNINNYKVKLFLFGVIISWGYKFIMECFINRLLEIDKQWNLFINYSSPTILIMSICIVYYFINIKINGIIGKKIIEKVVGLTFGVFLYHSYPLCFEYIITNKLSWIANYNVIVEITILVCITLCIYIIGLILDIIRIKLFKACKINKLIETITKKTKIKLCECKNVNN
ncbi:MAG: acyltransferase family protein [Lachnospira sp.]|jgi:hypothetical protein